MLASSRAVPGMIPFLESVKPWPQYMANPIMQTDICKYPLNINMEALVKDKCSIVVIIEGGSSLCFLIGLSAKSCRLLSICNT